MAKRGRKPKDRNYFGPVEEQAVVDYLNCEDSEEKNRIFNTYLRPALKIMAESIIRRYNLYVPDEEFQDTFDDAISFLITKISSFNPERNKKAYSYIGTIIKNYLIYKINQYNKRTQRNESYDCPEYASANTIIDNKKYSYTEDTSHHEFLCELTGTTAHSIDYYLKKKDIFHLNENQVKVGQALLTLFNNWNELFANMGSNKFNKSAFLMYLRESTMLNTKEIRDAMRIYKERYYEIKQGIIDE